MTRLNEPYTLLHSPYSYAANEAFRSYVKEKHPDAVFIEEIAIELKGGGYTDNPGIVFYQENPPAPYTNKFFAYYCKPDLAARIDGRQPKDQWVITGLKEDWNPVVEAAIHIPSRSLAISRYRHDYFAFPGGFIDGGRDYTRLGGSVIPQVVHLNLLTMQFEYNGETYNAVR